MFLVVQRVLYEVHETEFECSQQAYRYYQKALKEPETITAYLTRIINQASPTTINQGE